MSDIRRIGDYDEVMEFHKALNSRRLDLIRFIQRSSETDIDVAKVRTSPPQIQKDLKEALFTQWHGQRGSNPRPLVLETNALPAELCPFK